MNTFKSLVKAFLLTLTIATLTLQNAEAACTSCTKTYSGSGSTNFNLSGSDVLCVKSNLTGSINVNGNGATICVDEGVSLIISSGNFNGYFNLNSYGSTKFNQSVNLPANTSIHVYSTGSLTSSSFNFNGTGISITNEGSWSNTSNLTISSGSTFTNSGTLNMNNRNLTIQGTVTNQSSGIITGVNQLTVDGSNALFTNNGSVSVSGSSSEAFVVRNGGEVSNGQTGSVDVPNGRVKITGSGSEMSNSGSMTAADFTNDEALFVNNNTGSIHVTDYFENRGPTTNNGEVQIDGDFYQSNKGPSGQFINNGFVEIAQDFLVASGGYVSGSGGFQVGGTSTNDGNVSDVDICDQSSSSGGGFDGGSGTSNNTTTCSYSPLPVELLYFKKVEEGDHFFFQWETASEMNASHFVLEMKDEKGEMVQVGEYKCAGMSVQNIVYRSQNFEKGFNGMRYFRLTQYDYDGKFENFNWISVSGQENQLKSVRIFPNPAAAFVNVDLGHNLGGMVMLYNANGTHLGTFVQSAGSSTLTLNLEQYNVANFVFLEIITGDEVQRAKVLIE